MNPVQLLPSGVGPDNPQWHEVRRQGIGASEIAAVMGLSPWESPFSLWARKRGGWDVEPTEEMSTGTRVEPVVAEWWADQHRGEPIDVTAAGVYADERQPWRIASPDRLILGPCPRCAGHGVVDSSLGACPACRGGYFGEPVAVLECKWTARWDGWGEPGTDQIPVHYRTQVLWQCDVMGVDRWHLAVLGPGGFRHYTGVMDQQARDDLDAMVAAGADMMRRIAADDPPDVDAHPATTATLKQLHPSVEDREVEIPADLAAEWEAARRAERDAKARKDKAANQLRQLLGAAARGVCDGRKVVTRTVYEQRHVDVDAMRAEMPDLVDRHTTWTTVDKLIPSRKKDTP